MPSRAVSSAGPGGLADEGRQLEQRPRTKKPAATVKATNKPLQFVNITDPDQRHNEKNRKLVRSQAMRDFRKRQQSGNAKSTDQTEDASHGVMVKRDSGLKQAKRISAAAQLQQFGGIRSVPDGVWTQVYQPMSPRTSLVTCLGAGFVDPFGQSVVETKPYMYGLIEHFIRWLTPGQTPKQRAQNPLVTILVPLARAHAALFHAAISAAAANMTAQRGGKDPDYWSFLHRGHALRLLQEDLEVVKNRTSDVTIATILLISSSDHFFGNMRAFEMHKKAVQQIIITRGGLDALGLNGILKRVILWMSLAGAGTTAPTPHIKQRSEESSSSSSSEGTDSTGSSPSSTSSTSSAQSALPGSFTRLVHTGLISLDILSPMQVGCTLIRHRQVGDPLPGSFTEFASSAPQPIEMQLAEMVGPIFLHLRNLRNALSGSAKGSIEHCISIAAPIYYCTILLGMPFTSPELEELSKQLAGAFATPTYNWQFKNEYGCRLWLAVIGDAAAQNSWERRVAFAQDAQKTMETFAPGMEYEDFEAACADWLWHPTLVSKSKGFWHVIKQLKTSTKQLM